MDRLSDMFRPILEMTLRHCDRVVVTYRYPNSHESGWRGEFQIEVWGIVTTRGEVETALSFALPGSKVGAMSTRGEITITPPAGAVQPRREIAAAVHGLAVELVGRLDGERSPLAFSTRCNAAGAGIEVSK